MRSIFYLIAMMTLPFFVGCAPGNKYSHEVKVLDSLYFEVEDAEQRFNTIDAERTSQ
ncbi:MAG: hypothetical protein HKN32_06605, partial [Flavobacteriales bacterium]|nr:hypothetical protein [Flavobacteriales bacterium]